MACYLTQLTYVLSCQWSIDHCPSLKSLGVTTSNHLSFSDHIQHTISSCTQTHYAVKILRAHGAIDTVLQQAYRSVILSKVLQYIISSVWWGFTKVSDRQQIDDFIRQC